MGNKQFRELNYLDWHVKYDPSNMEKVLVHDKSGEHKFILEQKFNNAMAIEDRFDNDTEMLSKIKHFNKNLEFEVLASMESDMEVVNNLYQSNPALQDTLSKLLLTDSNGQHKNQKSAARLGAVAVEKIDARADLQARKSFSELQAEYLASKVNLSNYIN